MTMPSPSHWARLFGGQSAARPLLSPPPLSSPVAPLQTISQSRFVTAAHRTAPSLTMRREGEGSFPSLSLGAAAVLGRLSGGNRTLAGNLRNLMLARGCPCQRSHALIGWQGTVPETLTVGLVSASLFLRQEGLARADLGAGPYLRRGVIGEGPCFHFVQGDRDGVLFCSFFGLILWPLGGRGLSAAIPDLGRRRC